ncbi:MAG: OmpA family protein [Deltaproteobacteria bacterium]|nr:OmpA family protein [Deltaproteobacteria bacterium]
MKTIVSALAVAFVATAASAQADPRSSQQPEGSQLAAIEFERGSARLDRGKDAGFGMIAAWLEENPDGLVVLDGHADPSGPTRGNLKLSFARAKAVREALVTVGVDPDHIVIAAFGEGGPASTRDRRVIAWGTRAGMKAIVARTRAIGPSIVSTGLISALEMNPRPVVASR